MATTFPAENHAFLAICKKAHVPLFDDNDQSPIENIGALRQGLMALLKEEASDDTRAEILWTKAKNILRAEEANEVGAGAEGVVQLQDDFAMAEMGQDGLGFDAWP